MANKKYSQINIRKLFKKGGSFSVSLPMAMIKSLDWQEKQKVVVSRVHGGLLIRDWKKR